MLTCIWEMTVIYNRYDVRVTAYVVAQYFTKMLMIIFSVLSMDCVFG